MKGSWLINYMKELPDYVSIWLNYRNPMPKHVVIFVTENCNSRCSTCNFWKKKSSDELTIVELRSFFDSALLKNLKSVTISGGEPLLRRDLNEVIDLIYSKTKIKPSLNTNGLLPHRLDTLLSTHKERIDNILFSIDGPKKLHNRARGKGTFKTVLCSIKTAEKHGFLPCINMTLTKNNFRTLPITYKLFGGYHFSFKTAQNSAFYFGDNSKLSFDFSEDEKNELVKSIQKMHLTDMYTCFLPAWIKLKKRPLPCYAGAFSFILGAHGDISSCIHMPPVGNIRKVTFKDIWSSVQMQSIRKKNRKCQQCYERCTADTFLIDLPKWVLKQKYLFLNRSVKNLVRFKN